MSGLFSSLTSTAASLQSQGLSVQQAGKNISNINNPNYSRQRVLTGTITSTPTSIGPVAGPLVAIGLEQVRDPFIDRQIIGEVAFLSSLEVQDFRLRQALANLGDSIDRAGDAQFVEDIIQQGGGLRGAIDAFFDAFESFSARPNDATTRQVVFQTAESMVDVFHRVDNRYDVMEQELNEQIDQELITVNNLLTELEEINLEISRLEVAQPRSALDLRDLRQAKLEELSEFALIDANEVPGENGQVKITMRDSSGSEVVLLGPGEPSRQILFDEATDEFKIEGTGQVLDIQAGILPAVLEVRTNFVAEVRSKIDSLAESVATEINELYYQGFVAAGVNPAVPEISFFQQPTPPPSAGGTGTVTAASIELYSTPSDVSVTDYVPLTASSLRATDTGISGANELALAIADLATTDQSTLGDVNFSEFSARIVTELGQDIRNIQNRIEVQEDVKALLENRRGEVSGVSMDEEVASMVQFQRAYQATSRFFNVVSEMLDLLINNVGR